MQLNSVLLTGQISNPKMVRVNGSDTGRVNFSLLTDRMGNIPDVARPMLVAVVTEGEMGKKVLTFESGQKVRVVGSLDFVNAYYVRAEHVEVIR